MKRVKVGALGLMVVLDLCAPASAQAPSARAISLVGTWTGETPGQGGMTHGADQYRADGSYVSVMQLPNGTVQRLWGSYRTEQTSPRQLHVSFRVQGFLPREICAQAPGFPVSCSPNRVPETIDAALDFVSPSTFQTGGISMTRTAGSPLLQIRVPGQLVLAAQTPVQPYVRQPVMPGGRRYVTPSGPGSVQGMRQDDQAQQYRICAVNGGQVVEEQGGTVRCIH